MSGLPVVQFVILWLGLWSWCWELVALICRIAFVSFSMVLDLPSPLCLRSIWMLGDLSSHSCCIEWEVGGCSGLGLSSACSGLGGSDRVVKELLVSWVLLVQ